MDPSSDVVIQIVIVIILLLLSGFFSSSETALTTANRIRMRNLEESGSKAAMYVNKVVSDQGKMLSAILIGNNIVNLYASSLVTTMVTSLWGNKVVGFATGVLTLLILLFGEITPKTMATLTADSISLRNGRYIYYLMIVMTPVIFLINKLSTGILLLMKLDPKQKRESITEDELRTIVEVSHEEGVIQTEEKNMTPNVFDFGESLAKDIMVPRINMVLLDVTADYGELIESFRENRFTRMPVYEGSTDNVIGIINVKDLLLLSEEEKNNFCIRDYLRQPLYTYEFKKVADLMVEMRKTSNNIVIVLDEYGATAGLITLEDMLEEIVGEIRDEYDEDEEENLTEVAPDEYIAEGSMKLDDINESLNLDLESEDYDSIGGLVIGLLDHLPAEGESVEQDGIRFVVEKMDKNRIEKIHIYRMKKENSNKS